MGVVHALRPARRPPWMDPPAGPPPVVRCLRCTLPLGACTCQDDKLAALEAAQSTVDGGP